MTEMERNNKIAMMTHGINVGIMAAFLILQAVAGELSRNLMSDRFCTGDSRSCVLENRP